MTSCFILTTNDYNTRGGIRPTKWRSCLRGMNVTHGTDGMGTRADSEWCSRTSCRADGDVVAVWLELMSCFSGLPHQTPLCSYLCGIPYEWRGTAELSVELRPSVAHFAPHPLYVNTNGYSILVGPKRSNEPRSPVIYFVGKITNKC